MVDKIYSFLGLAAKAGKLRSGDDACLRTIKAHRALLLIVSEDASSNTKKRFADSCSYHGIPIRFFGEKDIIGRYIGKEARAVIAVTDGNFAKRLMEMIDSYRTKNGGEQFVESQDI